VKTRKLLAIAAAVVLTATPLWNVAADDAESRAGSTANRVDQSAPFGGPMIAFLAADSPTGLPDIGPMDSDGMAEEFEDFESQRRHLEQFRMLKMLEFLSLDEDQEVEFLTKYRSFTRDFRALDESRREVLGTLADGLSADSLSDGQIFALTDQVSKLNSQKDQRRLEFEAEARKLLSPRQYGKLVIFQQKFELELLKAVRGFRDRMGPGGRQSGRGPGWPGK